MHIWLLLYARNIICDTSCPATLSCLSVNVSNQVSGLAQGLRGMYSAFRIANPAADNGRVPTEAPKTGRRGGGGGTEGSTRRVY